MEGWNEKENDWMIVYLVDGLHIITEGMHLVEKRIKAEISTEEGTW